MRYKVGDKVYLKDGIKLNKYYGDYLITEEGLKYTEIALKITDVFPHSVGYKVDNALLIDEEMIDHEKTSRLSSEKTDEKQNEKIEWSLTMCGKLEEFHYKFDSLEEVLGFIRNNEAHTDSVEDYVIGMGRK